MTSRLPAPPDTVITISVRQASIDVCSEVVVMVPSDECSA